MLWSMFSVEMMKLSNIWWRSEKEPCMVPSQKHLSLNSWRMFSTSKYLIDHHSVHPSRFRYYIKPHLYPLELLSQNADEKLQSFSTFNVYNCFSFKLILVSLNNGLFCMADFLHSSKGSHFKKKKYTKFTASYEVYRLLKSLFIVNIIVKILILIHFCRNVACSCIWTNDLLMFQCITRYW